MMEGDGPTALIGAYEPGPGPGGLRALLPLAGMSVVEHQARRAIEAGAGRVLLLIDEAPANSSKLSGACGTTGSRPAWRRGSIRLPTRSARTKPFC